ncbi:hyaluronidase-5-like [Betta splendens]|uniref:Hyaluronidase n=1 Tax=Betta splendens TaxID=158456 RepID=A0A6P7MS66_BETSP|nr:hyaluronidase-5-like [Betta splendens]
MALFFLFWLTIVMSISIIHTLPPTAPPLIPDHPFVAIWNAPVDQCRRLDLVLDTGAFQEVTTPAAVPGQYLSLFYEERLGNYPRIDRNNVSHHGAVPQRVDLTEHLAKAKKQINSYIPKDSSPGLAVIDWESWRPLWDQNWGSKRMYQSLSRVYAEEQAPHSSSQAASKAAKHQFERAARSLMEETLRLGVRERPSRRWGFYLFPDCYNYGWETPAYTGRCSDKTQRQNEQMLWLWERSTALFPSIYLPQSLHSSHNAALYVRHRVQEAVRVAALPRRPFTSPVYVYSRPLYRDQNTRFLSEMDLVSSVGESAALGAAGVVMWGSSKDFTTKEACESLSHHLTSSLNPYLTNVTAAAMLCSQALCQGRGRCVRKRHDSSHYLHLDPQRFMVLQAGGKYVAVGVPSEAELRDWEERFTCQCYAGSPCEAKLVPLTKVKAIWV